jgi:acyl carrier protein
MKEQVQIQTDLLEFLRQDVFSEQIKVSEDTDLIANGFDSLSLVSLLQFIENKYELRIPETEVNKATLENVHSLAAVIVRLLNERQPLS